MEQLKLHVGFHFLLSLTEPGNVRILEETRTPTRHGFERQINRIETLTIQQATDKYDTFRI